MGTRTGTSGGYAILSVGSSTLANTKISAVDGTAFIDLSTADVLTDYLGWYLAITDSAGKTIGGYIKAAGTGETLDTEKVVNGTFVDGALWNPSAGWTIAGGFGVATNAAIDSSLWQANTVLGSAGQLLKTSIDMAFTDGSLKLVLQGLASVELTERSTDNAFVEYVTGVGTPDHFAIYPKTAGTDATVDNASVKQVLTPSATGITIVSTPGGTTYNWAIQETGFDYNDASNYTYTISTSGA